MKKFLWMTAIIAALALVFTGCPDGNTDPSTGPEGPPEITWTVAQKGGQPGATEGAAATEDSTAITITFSSAPGGDWSRLISITGSASIHGSFSASGAVVDIPISVNGTGNAEVTFRSNTLGIKAESQSVLVYQKGAVQPILITTAVADGASGETTSTKITITFDKDVSGLLVGDIAITNGTGNADKGTITVTADAKVWELGVTVHKEGDITVKITKDGIDSSPRTVAVYKKADEGIIVPEDGEDATWKWYRLTINEEGEEEPALGKGKIDSAEDFAKIVEAAGWQESFMRIYYDNSSDTSYGDGWGLGAVGNKNNLAGDSNLQFMYNASEVYAVLNFTDISKYFAEDDGFLFINSWKFPILGVVVFIPKNGHAVEKLPDGYYAISVPNMGPKGKGLFGTPDIDAINGAGPDAYLEIEAVYTGPQDWWWGCYIVIPSGSTDWSNGSDIGALLNPGTESPFIITIPISDILTEYGVTAGNLTHLGFNLNPDGYFTKITLIDPGAMDPDADATYNISANGTADTVDSTSISINFNKAVTGLAKTDITVTNGTGDVTVGELSGSGQSYSLGITVNTPGTITLKITKTGIEDAVKGPITVHKSTAVVVPDSGSDDDWVWTKLTDWEYGVGSDETIGKGSIVGDDFDAIMEAAGFKNTFIRVYYEYLPNPGSYPGGSVGGGTWNASISAVYKDVTLKAVKEGIAADDESVFFNVYNGVKIVGALLFVPKITEPEAEPITLYDGTDWLEDLGDITAASYSGSITDGVIKWFPGGYADGADRRLLVSFENEIDASGYTMLVLEFEGTYNMGGYCGFGFGSTFDYSGNAKSISNVVNGKFTVSCDLSNSVFADVDFSDFGGFGLTASDAAADVPTNEITLISVALK